MLIDAARIDAWAKSPEARHTLPELVRRLLLQAGLRLHRLAMPSGSGADRRRHRPATSPDEQARRSLAFLLMCSLRNPEIRR
jgi:hypothetical protein